MTFRWLHLSDTHFREDERWDRRATLQALIAKVGELKEKGLAPDLVFVTGDIAWSGKPKEYEQATRFFHELNKVLALDPKDRWFLVPGNHDVDRSRIKGPHRAVTASLTDETSVEELLLHDTGSMRPLSTRLEAYYTFASDFLGAARALQPDRPWRTDVREFDGASVGILQLNSAWIAEGGKGDDANLLVGEAQVREALNATPDALLRIALMHHPLRNLREFDAERVESLLGSKSGAAFLLRGHLHRNQTKIPCSPGHLIEIAAGTLYTEEALWPRGFHLGEVDTGKGEARINLFRYSGEEGGFFAPDNLTYEDAPNGIRTIKLPRNLLGGKKSKLTKAVSEEQRLSLTARYRNAAANYHGYARFIGFPNQAARPNASVSDLFVPLRMRAKGAPAETASSTTAEIAQRLLNPGSRGPARIVVLGDPGSGKTTLSRFLVMLTAGAITSPDVKVTDEPLPLRVAFRDFLEKRRENPNLSLLGYLELQASTELSLALPKDFLSKAIDNGKAILLLDGLDEVGAPEHRAAMRDLVAGFAAAHGKLPMLVTSRIAGFDDAPLSEQTLVVQDFHVIVPFSGFVLEKFDDDDLRTFVTHWYSVQEPSDPVARDRGIADLLAALNADERVRELARTPILATLIAMIHRVEANLPGERAKLYDLCVRMLLETWPAQAKRPFAEIDPSLQRAYLESLAFAMQTGRESYSRETVTIARGELTIKLLPILRRDRAGEPDEKVIAVIERWIDHLEKYSGIVVEQSTGVYAFFHLSIMEYLAAKGMERELGSDGSIAAIVKHFDESGWTEVCLLAVGSHAEDATFLDAVYQKVAQSRYLVRWQFLLRSLREEARFSPEQRETILGQAAVMRVQYGKWFVDSALVGQLLHFSTRHGEAVRRWIEHRINHAVGDDLAAAAALALEQDFRTLSSRLESRADRAAAAEALLEFWPGSDAGIWAASKADAATALRWSRRAPQDLARLRAVAAVGESSLSLPAASLINAITSTIQTCGEAKENLTRVAPLRRARGIGLPRYIMVRPGKSILATQPRSPLAPASKKGQLSARFAGGLASEFARYFASEFGLYFARDFASGFASEFGLYFARDFASCFASDFLSEFTHGFAHDFASYFAHDFNLYFARDFARYFARDFGVYFNRDFAHDFNLYSVRDFAGYFARYAHDFGLKSTTSPRLRSSSLTAAFRSAVSNKDAKQTAGIMFAQMTGEAWIAFATMAKSEGDDKRLGYFRFRLQNRWLFEVWSAIDQRLPEDPSPAHLALYFALGWAQSTTTWVWPDSERWRTLFAAGPGEHWLVRSQWHLCRLTDDPASKSDDKALRAALRDGHRDKALPGYAKRLAEILGIA